MQNSNISDDLSLSDALKTIRKRKSIIFWIISGLVFLLTLYSLKADYIYRSTAKLYIGLAKPKVVKIEDVLAQEVRNDQFLNTQYELLVSRSLARDVIKKLRLEEDEKFNNTSNWKRRIKSLFPFLNLSGAHSGEVEEKDITDPYTPVINKFLKRLKVTPVKESEIVNINFEGRSPGLITLITNTLAETYIVRNLELQSSINLGAETWLKTRAAQLAEDIKISEKKLQSYKNKTQVVDFDGKRDFPAEELNQLIREQIKAKSESMRLGSLYRQLKKIQIKYDSPIKTFLSVPLSLGDTSFIELKRKFLLLNSELESMQKAYTPKHPDVISLKQKIDSLKRRIPSELNEFINSTEIKYRSALTGERELSSSLENYRKKIVNVDNDLIQYNLLKQEVDSNKNLYDLLSSRIKELDFSSNYKETNVRIIDRAEVPLKPIKPKLGIYWAFTLVFGLFGGFLIIFLIETTDKTIKSTDDIESHFPYPLLGAIRLKPRGVLSNLFKNDSDRVDDIHNMRDELLSKILKAPRKVFLISSAAPGEGKTTVASKLAISLAQAGKRVALIDADFRNPKIHKIF